MICPFVGGGVRLQGRDLAACDAGGDGGAAGRAARSSCVLTRAQMYTSNGYRPQTIQHVSRRCAGRQADGAAPRCRRRNVATGDRRVCRARRACQRDALRLPECRGQPPPGAAQHAAADFYARAGRGERHLCARSRRSTNLPPLPGSTRSRCGCATTPRPTRTKSKPFSSKSLRECYAAGAEAFGWTARSPQPRSMRDGNAADRLGHGDRDLSCQPLQGERAVCVFGADGTVVVAGRRPRTSAPAPTRSWPRSRPTRLACRSTGAVRARRQPLSAGADLGRLADRGERRTRGRSPRSTRHKRNCSRWRSPTAARHSPVPPPSDLVLAGRGSFACALRRRCGSAPGPSRHAPARPASRPQASAAPGRRKAALLDAFLRRAIRRGAGRPGSARDPRQPPRRRFRRGPHPQRQDRAQPGLGRHRLRHRHGPARSRPRSTRISAASPTRMSPNT